jgi:hypothetical protein
MRVLPTRAGSSAACFLRRYLLQDVELKAGEYLYRQGEKYTDVVIVSQGQLELLYVSATRVGCMREAVVLRFEGKAITTYGARDVLSGFVQLNISISCTYMSRTSIHPYAAYSLHVNSSPSFLVSFSDTSIYLDI